MDIREKLEEWEYQYLSGFAAHSRESLGRDREETPCDIRTCYQRDRDRILHSKSFRRLKQKTQVFLAPHGDHYRTRLTHTLEVSQIARTVAKCLRLNEDLTEAIALGHDLGHTPFGHAGERALNKLCPDGFSHNKQSVRIVELLEKDGRGLNLTKEVRDGILNHQTNGRPMTLEGQVVRLADKIAYINHDIDDAIRGGILRIDDIPRQYTDLLGHTSQQRLNTMIHAIISYSEGKNEIGMPGPVMKGMRELRAFMFEQVYRNPLAKSEETKVGTMLSYLYEHYLNHPEELSEEYHYLIDEKKESPSRVVCDYIAGMSDHFCVETFEDIFIPKSWQKL